MNSSSKRKYCVRQRNNVSLALKSVSINPYFEGSIRLNNDASADRDGALNERRDIGFDIVSRSVRANQCQRNAKNTTHAEKLLSACRAQAEWRENITHDAERRGAEYQQLLQLAKEERKGIVNEEREALERDHQQQIETHLARLATINLRRQFEEEELRREAE